MGSLGHPHESIHTSSSGVADTADAVTAVRTAENRREQTAQQRAKGTAVSHSRTPPHSTRKRTLQWPLHRTGHRTYPRILTLRTRMLAISFGTISCKMPDAFEFDNDSPAVWLA